MTKFVCVGQGGDPLVVGELVLYSSILGRIGMVKEGQRIEAAMIKLA